MSSPGSAPPRVLVVGSINVDLVVVAQRLPGPGETVAGGRLERSGGGKGANQAVAAARAGAAVRLVGAVGEDDFGDGALDALRAEGIDVSGVERLAGAATGVALIVVDGEGANQIAVASGANHAVASAQVAPALDRLGAGVGCVLASFELPDALVLAGGERARAVGCPLVVNPAPARPLAPALRALQPILTPNEREAAELAGVGEPEAAARRLVELTGAPAVVTLGERGALVADDAELTVVRAPPVRATDTTGAGDTFNGVLAAELASGHDLRAVARVAVAAASLSVTAPGARGGMPDRAAIDTALGGR